jgi:hypothetical protein
MWEWISITSDGVTVYRNCGPQAAYAAVGVDAESDGLKGDRSYLLDFRWRR